MDPALGRIVLAEDGVNDKDLALAALAESGLANEVVWLRDGQEVLDYLRSPRRRPDAGPADGGAS